MQVTGIAADRFPLIQFTDLDRADIGIAVTLRLKFTQETYAYLRK